MVILDATILGELGCLDKTTRSGTLSGQTLAHACDKAAIESSIQTLGQSSSSCSCT